MKVGIATEATERPKLGETLADGLQNAGHTVILYESVQGATSAVLEARFRNDPLPCELLIIDPERSDETRLIERIRLFLRSEELSIIFLKNTSPIDIPIPNIRTLDKPITSQQLLAAIEQEG